MTRSQWGVCTNEGIAREDLELRTIFTLIHIHTLTLIFVSACSDVPILTRLKTLGCRL